MACIIYMSTLLIMGVSTFNGPFLILKAFVIFILDEFYSPYIMLHVSCKMH